MFERCVHDLLDQGIEAEIILFHPYDDGRWAIPQQMTHEDEMVYVRYLVARLGAHRNVWWSLANEYDLFGLHAERSGARDLRPRDWDTLAGEIVNRDPYGHLRSIHNWAWWPPYGNKEWMTHLSYQHSNTYSMLIDLRDKYGKPVVNDEYQYEGNLPTNYGNCSAELVMRRHWMAAMAGGYATHGEILVHDGNNRDLFWAYGGTLRGASPIRLRYMKELLTHIPFQSLSVDHLRSDGQSIFCLSRCDEFYFYLVLPEFKDRHSFIVGSPGTPAAVFEAEIHDVWECRFVRSTTLSSGGCSVDLPKWAVMILRVVPPATTSTGRNR